MDEPEFALKALLILTNAGLGFLLVGWVVAKQLKLRNGVTSGTPASSGDSMALLTQVSMALQGMEQRTAKLLDDNHEELRIYMQRGEQSSRERNAEETMGHWQRHHEVLKKVEETADAVLAEFEALRVPVTDIHKRMSA